MKINSINILKQKKGGTLLITIVILSVMIFLLMSAATIKLTEVARHAARANEKLRYVGVMEDLGQAVARAYVLGQGTCTAGTTLATISGVNFCVPNNSIGGGAGGVTGLCVDLDQSNSTTYDRYCVAALTIVTQNEFLEEYKKMVAEKSTSLGRIRTFLKNIFMISSAYATCNWFAGTSCNPVVGTAGSSADITPPVELNAPAAYAAAPVGAATEQTPGAVATPRNNLETWSPNISAWAGDNQIHTPNCIAADNYWLGCIRCSAPFRCIKISLCPPTNPSCPASQRYEQLISVW